MDVSSVSFVERHTFSEAPVYWPGISACGTESPVPFPGAGFVPSYWPRWLYWPAPAVVLSGLPALSGHEFGGWLVGDPTGDLCASSSGIRSKAGEVLRSGEYMESSEGSRLR